MNKYVALLLLRVSYSFDVIQLYMTVEIRPKSTAQSFLYEKLTIADYNSENSGTVFCSSIDSVENFLFALNFEKNLWMLFFFWIEKYHFCMVYEFRDGINSKIGLISTMPKKRIKPWSHQLRVADDDDSSCYSKMKQKNSLSLSLSPSFYLCPSLLAISFPNVFGTEIFWGFLFGQIKEFELSNVFEQRHILYWDFNDVDRDGMIQSWMTFKQLLYELLCNKFLARLRITTSKLFALVRSSRLIICPSVWVQCSYRPQNDWALTMMTTKSRKKGIAQVYVKIPITDVNRSDWKK